jgi:rhodanese-related sulfurtransferase
VANAARLQARRNQDESITVRSFTRNTSNGIRFSALAQIFGLVLIFNCLIFLTQDHFDYSGLFASPQNHNAKSTERLGSVETIELAQTLQLFNNERTIFLDIRDKQFYDYGHIERAANVPIDEIPFLSGAKVDELKKAQAVVIYCNGLPCNSVYIAAQKLSKKGLNNIKIYVEGWPEWRSCQLPVAMSEQMKRDLQQEHL